MQTVTTACCPPIPHGSEAVLFVVSSGSGPLTSLFSSFWVRGLCASYFPHQVCDANLLARLLIVVKPLALVQFDGLELGARLLACGKPFALVYLSVALSHFHVRNTYIGLELDKLKPSAVELEYVLHLRWIRSFIGSGRGLDIRRVFTLRNNISNKSTPEETVRKTLQFLHFHTKLASPLLPLISFCSKRLTDTQLGCVSRHDVHCTLNE